MLCSWGDHDWLLEKEITRRENEATTQGQNTGRRVPCVRPPWMATETREQLGTDQERKGRCLGETEEVLGRLTAEPIELQRLHTRDRRSELGSVEGNRSEDMGLARACWSRGGS